MSRFATWEAMKPAAPVMRMFFGVYEDIMKHFEAFPVDEEKEGIFSSSNFRPAGSGLPYSTTECASLRNGLFSIIHIK